MARPQRGDLDSPWKDAVQHFLASFLAFFFPRLHRDIDWSRGYVALDKEFQQIVRGAKAGRRLADKLFRVWLSNGKEKWLLIHIEVQGGKEKRFARRMFQYNHRCFDLYQRRVISLAVLTDDRPNWRPDRFRYGGWGCKIGIVFPVAKLLDYQPREAELVADRNPFAQIVLAHLKALETRRNPRKRRHWKLHLVRGLYERGWHAADVRQLFRLIDWIMDLPPELEEGFRAEMYRYEEEKKMPYLSSIERLAMKEGLEKGLKEGRSKGRMEGRREGRREGLRKGLLETIEAGLNDKFREAGLQLLPDIRSVKDLQRLRAIARKLISANHIDEVRNLLQ